MDCSLRDDITATYCVVQITLASAVLNLMAAVDTLTGLGRAASDIESIEYLYDYAGFEKGMVCVGSA